MLRIYVHRVVVQESRMFCASPQGLERLGVHMYLSVVPVYYQTTSDHSTQNEGTNIQQILGALTLSSSEFDLRK